MSDLDAFIDGLPKAELHVHLEGSLEPSLLLTLAQRNGVDLPWDSEEAIRAAYEFDNLQSFLELYWAGCRVLRHEQDFYEMTRAYLERARQDNVLHAELMLSPQNFITRGIGIQTVMGGVLRGMDDAKTETGISTGLIIVIQRQRSERDAFAVLEAVEPWSDRVDAFGLGGPEVQFPPSGFVEFFRICHNKGFRATIHAGEEGPAGYVREAVELLQADRIDHGNACLDDPDLVRVLVERQIPLTMCPLSNLRLKVIPAMDAHPLRTLIAQGVKVTINSDDPSYFCGYVNDNYKACQRALGLGAAELAQIARNSFNAAFLSETLKMRYLGLLDSYLTISDRA